MNTIKKNLFYNSIYQILAFVAPLVTTPYVSRVLGAEGTGLYSYAYSIAFYFVMFAMLGLNNYGNRTIAIVRNDKNKLSRTFWSIYIFQLIASIVMLLCYVFYLSCFGTDEIMGIILIGYVISAALDINWFFYGLEEFRITVIRNTIVKILTISATFLFVKTSGDVYIYGGVQVLGIILSQVLLWIPLRRYVVFKKVKREEVTAHIKPNFILFIPVIAVSVYKMLGKIMLGNMIDTIEVGYYEAGDRIIQIPVTLINVIGTVMLPRMSHLVATNNKELSNKYISKSILLIILLSTSLSFGLMGVLKEFIPLFFGPGFTDSIYVLQYLLPSCIFLAFANVIRTQYLIPNQQDSKYVKSVLLGAVVNIIINLILIPRYAAIGAAIGTLSAEITVCLVQCWETRKQLPIVRYFFQSFPFLIAGVIMYLVLLQINLNVSVVAIIGIKVLIGIVVYFLVLLVVLLILKKMKVKVMN